MSGWAHTINLSHVECHIMDESEIVILLSHLEFPPS